MKFSSMAKARFILVAGIFVAGVNLQGARVSAYLNKPEQWFSTTEAKQVAARVLSYQSELGGWPKNTDTTANLFSGNRNDLKPTFDNGATTGELRFLARMFNATQEEQYRKAFALGYDYILKAQYPTGGWPQYFPPPKTSYHRHITFNDGAMVRLMEFLRETCQDPPASRSAGHPIHYQFVEPAKKQAAREVFDRGIQCILKCQIRVNGKLTAWCAQHDEIDFSPRLGRSYELASISGAESVGILRLLMSLDQPSPEVVRAVEGAIAWFESAKIQGIRERVEPDAKSPKGKNKIVVSDPSAPPIWARFYEITSNRPLFVDRDGVPKYTLAEIGYERRNGYDWYGHWPQSLLEKEYPAWKAKWLGKPNSP